MKKESAGEKRKSDDQELKNKELKSFDSLIYPEHNDNYLQECLLNLHNKGIDIVIGR